MAKLGFSGGVAARFLTTEITPLLALLGCCSASSP